MNAGCKWFTHCICIPIISIFFIAIIVLTLNYLNLNLQCDEEGSDNEFCIKREKLLIILIVSPFTIFYICFVYFVIFYMIRECKKMSVTPTVGEPASIVDAIILREL